MTDADKLAFAKALARLAVALREPAPDVVMVQVYFRALADREIEFVVIAAEELLLAAKWVPKTSEWRAAAVRVEADRVEAHRALLRKLPAPLCEACRDSGWARDEQDRVTRCDCSTLRRLEVLGRAPWPALPATTVPDGEITDSVSVAEMIEARTGVKLRPRSMPSTWVTRRARHEDDPAERDA
jgi:hypothetical protein